MREVPGSRDRGLTLQVGILLGLVVCLSGGLEAAPQQPGDAPGVDASLARIRKQVEKPAEPRIKIDVRPVAKFKSGVEERVVMLTFEEQLHKEFDMTTPLQRQSQNWRSRCCGLNLLAVPKVIDTALHRRQEGQARRQVARELADLEAARAK